jgi:hypothetical protein
LKKAISGAVHFVAAMPITIEANHNIATHQAEASARARRQPRKAVTLVTAKRCKPQ